MSRDFGCRWFQANGVTPLFPLGHGLTYTSFALGYLTLNKSASGVMVTSTVATEGMRSGAEVVHVDVNYPSSADEPAHNCGGSFGLSSRYPPPATSP
jgi:beta-glucosidase